MRVMLKDTTVCCAIRHGQCSTDMHWHVYGCRALQKCPIGQHSEFLLYEVQMKVFQRGVSSLIFVSMAGSRAQWMQLSSAPCTVFGMLGRKGSGGSSVQGVPSWCWRVGCVDWRHWGLHSTHTIHHKSTTHLEAPIYHPSGQPPEWTPSPQHGGLERGEAGLGGEWLQKCKHSKLPIPGTQQQASVGSQG